MNHRGAAKSGLIQKLNLLCEQVKNVEQNLSERRRTEQSLRKSEEKYRDLFENANDAIFLVDAELNYFDANKKAVELLGYSRRELLGMNIFDQIPPEQRRRSAEEFKKLRRQGKYDKFRGKVKTRDGRWLDIEVSSSAIFEGDRYIGSRDIIRDITMQVRTEQSLRESEARLKEAQRIAHVGDWEWDVGTNKVEWSEELYRIYGYEPYEIAPDYGLIVEAMHPDSRDRFLTAIAAALNEDRPFELDYAFFRKDWSIAVLHTIGKVMRDGRGAPLRMVGIAQDITAQRRADETLRESEGKFKAIFDYANDGILIADVASTKFTEANKSMCAMLGYSRKEITSLSIRDIHPKKELPSVLQEFEKQISGEKTVAADVPVMRKNGSIFYADICTATVMLGGRKYSVGIFRDITERRQSEEALKNSEKFVKEILDTVDAGFIVVDPDFRIVTANKAYCGQVGGTRREVLGRHCYEVSHRSNRPCHEDGEECPVRCVFETGEPYTALHRHRDANDAVLYAETKGFPIKDESGRVTSVIEVVNDITEKHVLEEVRLKTQKLEAIGTLAGGIAHDFNNLLQGVFGYIHMAKTLLDEKERSRSRLEQAEQALNRCVNLTKQLLTFSKGGMPLKKPIAIEQVIEESVKFALSGSSSDYRILFDPGVWKVEADEGQIAQVIQNIVLNADQAMPKGGTIMITARNVRLPGTNPLHLLEEGNYLEIAIQDSGTGISEQHLPKIFDPYFTTRQKGSGLGLATAYSIVKNHGGMINVVSEVNKGSTFFIYLPALEKKVESLPEISQAGRGFRKGKILVMDDEQLVREIAIEMLKDCGHKVDSAEHGEEAISKYRTARESGMPFDIIILDLTIRGGLGGKETMARLREIDPGIRAIVSSGYSDDTVISEFSRYGFSARLTKPYKFEDLRDIVNRLLP